MNKEQLLARIEDLRKAKGWSKMKLNEEAELSPGTIYQWYRTDRIPTIRNLTAICNALDITLGEFFTIRENDEEKMYERELYRLLCSLTLDDKRLFTKFLREYIETHCNHDRTGK